MNPSNYCHQVIPVRIKNVARHEQVLQNYAQASKQARCALRPIQILCSAALDESLSNQVYHI